MSTNPGKLSFPVETDRLLAGLETGCLGCATRFRVGPVAVVMRCGKERLGFFCPRCVVPEVRKKMAHAAANLRSSDDDC